MTVTLKRMLQAVAAWFDSEKPSTHTESSTRLPTTASAYLMQSRILEGYTKTKLLSQAHMH